MRTMSKCLACDRRGSTITEFALIAPVMALILMGFLDLGHSMYTRSVLQGAMEKASRDGTLESGSTSTSTIDAKVQSQVRPVAGRWASYVTTRKSYSQFGKVGTAETYIDSNGNGVRNAGECFQDENGNSTWDADRGKTGQGGASDVVLYTMTATYPRMFPLARMLGWSSNVTITGQTVLRNQPYGVQTFPSVTICT